jgi:hypothetical protein
MIAQNFAEPPALPLGAGRYISKQRPSIFDVKLGDLTRITLGVFKMKRKSNTQPRRYGPLGETKQDVTDRLRAEGRWDEFAKRRDELRHGGMSADDAWEQLVPEFQPLAAAEPPRDAPLRGVPVYPEVLEFEGDFNPLTDTNIINDVAWAYHNFGNFVSPPPSPGAVELLNWARSNRTKSAGRQAVSIRRQTHISRAGGITRDGTGDSG